MKELANKKERLEDVERKLMQASSVRKDDKTAEKLGIKLDVQDEKHKEEVNALQFRLNTREAEISRMESLLIELHQSVDEVRREKEAARIDKDMVVIQKIQAEEALKYAKT